MKAEEADEVKEAEVAEGEEAESVGEKKSWRVSAGGLGGGMVKMRMEGREVKGG